MDICPAMYITNTYALEQIVYLAHNLHKIAYVLDPCIKRGTFNTCQSTYFKKRTPSLKFFFNELDLPRIESLVHQDIEFIYLPEAYRKRVIAQ